jgi:hypothetical protein
MKTFFVRASLAFVLSAVVMQAHAADLFTVNVPVEFKNLHPDIIGVEFCCRLQGKDPITGNLIYYAKNLPYEGAMGKSKTIKPANGNIPAQTIKFVFKTEDFVTQELNNLSLVTQADCNFNLNHKNGTSYNPAAVAPTQTTIAPKPGTPFRSSTTAPF